MSHDLRRRPPRTRRAASREAAAQPRRAPVAANPRCSFEILRLEQRDDQIDENHKCGQAGEPIDPVHERSPLPMRLAQKRINHADRAKKPTIKATKIKSIMSFSRCAAD